MNCIKPILFGAASLLAVQTANAVAAYPGLLPMTQPDGTTIQVRIVGDEFGSAYLTEDGYLLKRVGNAFYYADMDDNGVAVSSGILATQPSLRTVGATEFLGKVDMKGRVFPALERSRAARVNGFAAKSNAPQLNTTTAPSIGLFPGYKFPTKGKIKALVLLVDYPDQPFTLGEEAHDYFSRLLNERGFSDYDATGSAVDWYVENSCGQFVPEFDVYGPVTLPHPMAYYGGHSDSKNDANPQRMVTDACAMLDDTIDFSEYDLDGDGFVDNVFVFYSGLSEAAGGVPDCVWPHSWDLTMIEPDNKYIHDGVQLDHYACTNEWHYKEEIPDGIGTFIHEFSHVMGLPDLYATNNQFSYFITPNQWDTMDRGNYNNNSRTPPNFSAFERYALGWLEPYDAKSGMDLRLKPVDESNSAVRISTASPAEFFLFENRQQKRWDTYVPAHGMLVWHIDYEAGAWSKNIVNDDPNHQHVDIVEANNSPTDPIRTGMTFPGTDNVTELTDYTIPSMTSWSGALTGKPVTDIAESEDGVITFKVMGGGEAIGAPTVTVDNVHNNGFTVKWTHHNAATFYEVSVYSLRGSTKIYADGYKRFNAGCTTTLAVDGLRADTEYRVEVVSANNYAESPASAAVKVKTGKEGFVNSIPQVTEATDVTASSFTINWNEMDEAVDYRVNVYTKSLGEGVNESADFANGAAHLPTGWITNATATYSQDTYSGAAAPSLRLSGNEAYIQTPMFTKDVRSISFWTRGVNAKGKGTINIYGYVNGKWILIDAFVPTDSRGGETHSRNAQNLPVGVRSVRIELTCADACNVAIDDVKILWGGNEEIVPLASYTDAATGNVTGFKVNGLAPLTTYYYTVAGVNAAGDVSRYSAEQHVFIGDNSDISDIDADASGSFAAFVTGNTINFVNAHGPVTVSTPSGVAFVTTEPSTTVASGLYIVTDGTKAAKVVVR